MRIEVPHHTERFGAVRIHSVQEIWELDSGVGSGDEETADGWQTVRNFSYEAINSVCERMAIVVPCKDERLKVLDGVLAGIPHDCLIILVSNSARQPIDRYQMEIEQVSRFCQLVARNAVMVHQRDLGVALALEEAGLGSIIDDDGVIKDGKGEGMLIGLALAKLAGREFIGYVDADNYVPGAVHEYCKAYAAGLHMARSPFSMVRISWRSKPKVQGGRLFFNRWGRTSQVTNRFFNLLLAEYSGFGTEIVATGNAGEHAFSVALAERMRFGTGFSVEPYQFINLFEDYGGVNPAPYPEVMRQGVEIFQVETRNPHLHEDKGTDHIQEMRLQALNVLYHSSICPPAVREEIRSFLGKQDQLVDGEVPAGAGYYPPLVDINWDTFKRVIGDKAETFTQTELHKAVEVVTTAPIVFDLDADDEVDLRGELDEAVLETAPGPGDATRSG